MQALKTTTESEITAGFRQSMRDTGIDTDAPLIADGQRHRFHVEGDKSGSRNGWYILFDGKVPAGAFGCWKRGIHEKWCSKSWRRLSPKEQEQIKQRYRQTKILWKEEHAKIHAEARERAVMILENASEAQSHAYLDYKGVKAYDISSNNGSIIIPMQNSEGSISSLQFIDTNGNKMFLSGGKIEGCYHLIGRPETILYIVEGYATGATIYEATGGAVAVAFNAGNLKNVAKNLRRKYGDISIVIAADNDAYTEGNPGLRNAEEAANAVGGKVAIPEFKDTTSKPTDFNDLFQLEDAVRVKELLEKAYKPNQEQKTRIFLPNADGQTQSSFASEVGEALKDKNFWFIRGGEVVEITKIELNDRKIWGFKSVTPERAVTELESHIEFGKLTKKGKEGPTEFFAKSIIPGNARILLASEGLKSQLPVVERLLTVPIPILREGNITWPKTGYDPANKTFLLEGFPEINPLPLDEAKAVIREMFGEYCFRSKQDLTHAIAALITPYCRGLFPRWTVRGPFNIYEANRERAGKDHLAANTQIIYVGEAIESPPLNNNTEEIRKRITSALIGGAQLIHFANCKGNLRNPVIETIITAENWEDRELGKNKEVKLCNELQLSLSANTGFTYSPDLANRSRIIKLFYGDEHANSRVFKQKDLSGWVLKNRGRILSALAGFVQHWDSCGRPKGATPFTSYPKWAEIVGGIMVACNLGDPCLPQDDSAGIGGDSETESMKQVYLHFYEYRPNEWMVKKDIKDEIIKNELEIFQWVDLKERKGQTYFGMLLGKYVGRSLGGVRLEKQATQKNSRYHNFRFIKENGNGRNMDEIFDLLETNSPTDEPSSTSTSTT